jgi:hypothetical protein
MTDTNQVEATEAAVENTENQVNETNEQSFTQDQLDRILEDRLAKQRRALEKRYAGVDPEHYKELASAEEQKKLEDAKAKGEFEKILKETVGKKESTIEQLRSELHSVKVDGAVLSAANKLGAINAQQVVALLKTQIRLSDDGNAEVVDDNGNPRYTEKGDPMQVENLVSSFLETNPHFARSTPGGTGSKSNLTPAKSDKINLADLDLTRPDHRKLYTEARNKGLV